MSRRKKEEVVIRDIKKKIFRPLNEEQERYVNLINTKQVVICTGKAGTGKSLVPIAIAIKGLVENNIDKLILTRPIVECGNEKLGSLPGSFEEKIEPYMLPMIDIIDMFLSQKEIENYYKIHAIDCIPIAYMRGHTFRDCFVIADEAQNMNLKQLIMLFSRIGTNCKLIINGDMTQADLPDKKCALTYCIQKLKDLQEVGIIDLVNIVRNDLISKILERLQ